MEQLTIFESKKLINLEETIEKGLKTFVEVGNALMEIRDGKLYRSTFSTFEDYCRDRWGMSRPRAYQLIDAAQVFNTVSTIVDTKPTNEAQARPLTSLSSDQQLEVWPIVVESAPNGKITGAHVQRVVDEYNGSNRQEFDYDSHLDEALTDESKPVCPECGQVYEGESCPDCNPRDFNYKRDNKSNRRGDPYTPMGYDACQTPPEALEVLRPYLTSEFRTIWEPAAGDGYLAQALQAGFHKKVIATDILTDFNFFTWEPSEVWDALITNPPYSIKYQWLSRCYELRHPFALLMPVEMLGAKTAQELFDRHGIEIILLNKRVNFKMPIKGWDSHAQFATAWFTYGLSIGRQLTFGKIETNGTPDPDDSIL